MKTKLKLLCAAALMFAAFTAHSQCSAGFIINDEGGGNIQFASTSYNIYYVDSLNPVSFIWAFGDGTNDTTFQSANVHHYANGGTYNICLTIIDSLNACYTQQCDTYHVNLCTGTAQFGSTLIGFGDYSFNATVLGNGYSGTWNFGDGGAASGFNTSHQFIYNETYNVCFQVAGPGCADTTCQPFNIDIYGSFDMNFTYHVVSINPYTAEFVSLVPSNPDYFYQWIFSDGGYNSGTGLDSVQHAFANNGNYTVTLVVGSGNAFSDSLPFFDTVSQVINIDRCDLTPRLTESSNGETAYFNTYLTDSLFPGYQNDTISDFWNFPGGTPSSSANSMVSVTYPALGTYTATLFVSLQSGCTDTLYDTFTLTPPPPPTYTIEGQVTGGPNGGQAIVYLVVQDSVGYLALEDSTFIYLEDTIGLATYYFYNLPVDTYYVKAALVGGNPDSANYLPTYYTNSLSWSTATPVYLTNSNANGIDIALTPGNNPGGPGFVGGYVSQGAGIDVHTGNNTYRSVGDPIAGVQINLLTGADEAVAYTYTDATGHYQFSDLAYGSYHIYAEQLNKVPVPVAFTLSPSDSSITSLNISINSDSATATGINEVNNELALTDIYPNPVLNQLEVLLSSKQASTATIKLVDVLGSTILTNNTRLVQGNNKLELDMQSLAAGVYQLLIQTNGQHLTYKVVKAK